MNVRSLAPFAVRLALAAAAATPAAAQTALSERLVAYEIDARLEARAHVIEATQVLTYRNRTGRALDEFPFHLYLNAFAPRSTFMREARRDNPSREWKPQYLGSIEVTSLQVPGMGDLTRALEFIQPDDGNRDDRTVARVRLPRPVPDGAEVQFRIAFRARLPENVARTGYKRSFVMGGQWFPKLGVWWKGAWNCHQFHRMTEFFADFGSYDVKLTVPRAYVVGATGEQRSAVDNADGTRTLTYHAEDVHDFAWAADPDFRVFEESWTGSAGTVRLRLLAQPERERLVPRCFLATRAALERFDRWYGPYPYRTLTLVDPAHGSGAGGVEYPTLFTLWGNWLFPSFLRVPELVAVHEFGHQYWYGMVATNEVEDAWLDEGLDDYATEKVLESLYGRDRALLDLPGWHMGIAGFDRQGYRSLPHTDPIVRTGYEYLSSRAYGITTYKKTTAMLLTLEGLIGEETVGRALRTYFTRYRFTHPTEEDFLRTVEEVAGRDLGWFFDQAVRGTQVLDYAVTDLRSDPVDWFESKPAREAVQRSTVVVQRIGDFVFPVEVEVRFDDGLRLRERWDGRDRWVRYAYERTARVTSAEIDPDHKVRLDRELFNDSRTREGDGTVSRKLAGLWLLLTQLVALLASGLA